MLRGEGEATCRLNIEKLILAWVYMYMYLHIKKEAFGMNYDKVLWLVVCSVVFANYTYIYGLSTQ